MLEWLYELLTNPFLITAILAWFVAQVMKTIIYAVLNRKLRLERMVGDGGMPSGHSATVSSMAALSLLIYGPGSYEFAISTLLAIIVCHDAMGVRRESGKHAVVLNEMMRIYEKIFSEEELTDVELKEFVGHTPLQVTVGIGIGIISAFAAWLLWFN
ncbi:MAG: divergent PAP2 family protein [Clostridia bacterium]|nr:divergent PAP2 family protein [Clostridia bacterium]